MDVQVTRRLSANPEVGLLLPCNIAVRRSVGRSIDLAVDPGALLGVAAVTGVELRQTASDADTRLRSTASLRRWVAPTPPDRATA
ncbi:DUF302 domain-containing protein [Actinomycetospora chibensis]|uniref:DUF302 domain-containing protein n=1 Tax=Actinomycetospora chibensis TaxID=663606 RepID=A0ABV9RNW3_9PSEU